MAGNIVIVTLYTTVYPSSTLTRTLLPSSRNLVSTANSSSHLSKRSISRSLQTPSMITVSTATDPISTMLSEVSMSEHTSMAISTSTAHPFGISSTQDSSTQLNPAFPALIVTTIVLLALFFGFLIAYIAFLAWRGDCPKCKDAAARLKKWESGELKVITKDMVKIRESINSQKSTATPIDLERQALSTDQQSRWARAIAAIPWKKEYPPHPRPRITIVQKPESVYTTPDRFFEIPDIETRPSTKQERSIKPVIERPEMTRHPALNTQPVTPHGDLNFLQPPSSPSSVYSRATDATKSFAGRPFVQYDVPPMPRGSQHARVESYAPSEQYPYDSAGLDVHRENEATRASGEVPGQRMVAPKRRSRTYGGLPPPEEFDNSNPTTRKPPGNWI